MIPMVCKLGSSDHMTTRKFVYSLATTAGIAKLVGQKAAP